MVCGMSILLRKEMVIIWNKRKWNGIELKLLDDNIYTLIVIKSKLLKKTHTFLFKNTIKKPKKKKIEN